jgi:hypothetical protein
MNINILLFIFFSLKATTKSYMLIRLTCRDILYISTSKDPMYEIFGYQTH